jgi:hypothetical protein
LPIVKVAGIKAALTKPHRAKGCGSNACNLVLRTMSLPGQTEKSRQPEVMSALTRIPDVHLPWIE